MARTWLAAVCLALLAAVPALPDFLLALDTLAGVSGCCDGACCCDDGAPCEHGESAGPALVSGCSCGHRDDGATRANAPVCAPAPSAVRLAFVLPHSTLEAVPTRVAGASRPCPDPPPPRRAA
jgi:hypothetical protein